MPGIPRRLPSGLALALALSALAAPAGAIAATDTTATGHSATPPTFTVPASARVHGSTPTTTPVGAAPNVATTTPASAAPSAGAATTPAGAASAGAATTPATAAPASTTPASAVGAPASTTPALPTGSAATRAPGAPHTTTAPTRLSTGAIVVAALAALLILICLAWGTARWFAYEPRWSISLHHSLAEASWRLSASWDEFSDWARLGR